MLSRGEAGLETSRKSEVEGISVSQRVTTITATDYESIDRPSVDSAVGKVHGTWRRLRSEFSAISGSNPQ